MGLLRLRDLLLLLLQLLLLQLQLFLLRQRKQPRGDASKADGNGPVEKRLGGELHAVPVPRRRSLGGGLGLRGGSSS